MDGRLPGRREATGRQNPAYSPTRLPLGRLIRSRRRSAPQRPAPAGRADPPGHSAAGGCLRASRASATPPRPRRRGPRPPTRQAASRTPAAPPATGGRHEPTAHGCPRSPRPASAQVWRVQGEWACEQTTTPDRQPTRPVSTGSRSCPFAASPYPPQDHAHHLVVPQHAPLAGIRAARRVVAEYRHVTGRHRHPVADTGGSRGGGWPDVEASRLTAYPLPAAPGAATPSPAGSRRTTACPRRGRANGRRTMSSTSPSA